MAGDELQALNGLLEVLSSLVSNILVAGAVEAVAADAVLLIVLIGDGVHISLRGHGAVESGVEDSDHRDVAEDLAGCLDAEDACGVVQRSQGAQLTDGVDDLVGDQAAGLELLTAVDDAVADGADLADIVDALALAGGHLLHDLSKSLGVGGEDRGSGSLVAVSFMGDHAALHADALAQTLAQHLLTVHIDELIFQGRRTTVDNQNFHLLVSSRYVFVHPRKGRILQIPRIII